MTESARRGAQSMKAAFVAKLVVGFPDAGPTCSAVTRVFPMQPWVGTPFRFCGVALLADELSGGLTK